MDSILGVFLFAAVVACIVAYQSGRSSRDKEVIALRQDRDQLWTQSETDRVSHENTVVELRSERAQALYRLDRNQDLTNTLISALKNDSALLPTLARWADRVQGYKDEALATDLEHKLHPAPVAAEAVRESRRLAREARRECEIARNRVDLYESLAPWLVEFTTIPLDDLLESVESERRLIEIIDGGGDPISHFVPIAEWSRMSESERNQLALDRYNDPARRRTPAEAGIVFERFSGYQFEVEGYRVEYHGALRGKQDEGIDLVCDREDCVLVVQCKRLAAERGLPVRERVVAQTYGAAEYYRMSTRPSKPVKPVIVTTYQLSDEARRFARFLRLHVRENQEIKPYPMIKCNVSRRNGTRIYHLPLDQQYDRVRVGDHPEDFYAWTVAEAEEAGFRRAFRWRGEPSQG